MAHAHIMYLVNEYFAVKRRISTFDSIYNIIITTIIKKTLLSNVITVVYTDRRFSRANRCVAVADLPRALPQPKGHMDVYDYVRQSHRVSARLVEMLCQQLPAVGSRFHVVFHQHTRCLRDKIIILHLYILFLLLLL